MEGAAGSPIDARHRVAALEAKERRALDLIVDGHSLVKVAGELSLTLERAARLKASLMEKLGARTTADLVRIGLYAQIEQDS